MFIELPCMPAVQMRRRQVAGPLPGGHRDLLEHLPRRQSTAAGRQAAAFAALQHLRQDLDVERRLGRLHL